MRLALTAAVIAMGAVGLSGCSSQDEATAIEPGAAGLPSFPEVPENATMTLNTTEGVIEIAMDPQAPLTDASMAYLSAEGYFDGTPCHRLTTAGIYVLQCGDPTGSGTGGPGYRIPDENLPQATADNYPAGTVAMANSGPNTNGSQFFIVYENTSLPPNYTIWGEVTSGLDNVLRVAQAGVAGGGTDGAPALPVTIESTQVAAD
jgi:peptidyl-prolyl cis-trans isomerase B (cyclophilin B)